MLPKESNTVRLIDGFIGALPGFQTGIDYKAYDNWGAGKFELTCPGGITREVTPREFNALFRKPYPDEIARSVVPAPVPTRQIKTSRHGLDY